jgi:hypothetical protein
MALCAPQHGAGADSDLESAASDGKFLGDLYQNYDWPSNVRVAERALRIGNLESG